MMRPHQVLLLIMLLVAGTSRAQSSASVLTTGNGYGFQLFDTTKQRITGFLEHPYRYLRPAQDPRQDGIGRRNLAFDFYFGVGNSWLSETGRSSTEYLDQSHIIHVTHSLPSGSADSYYFSPFDFPGNAMVAMLHAPHAERVYALFNFHLGDGDPNQPNANSENLRRIDALNAIVETGPGGGATIYLPLSPLLHIDHVDGYGKVKRGQTLADNPVGAGNDQVPVFAATVDAENNFAVAVLYVDDASTADAVAGNFSAWVAQRRPGALLSDARREFESWRVTPPSKVWCSDAERALWRQSEAVLRMAQVREPNTASRRSFGMMLAALPPGEWHTGWVRDGSYATVALARMGHFTEAKHALNFFVNAGPVGQYANLVNGQGYLVSVCRYFGNGAEEADYSGQATPNVEIDGWGLVLWAARQYVEAAQDSAWLSESTQSGKTVYEALQSGVAQPIEANIEDRGIARADSSIWEVHDQNRQHFAYTSLALARGLCDFSRLATLQRRVDDAAHFGQLAQVVKEATQLDFTDEAGALGSSLESLANAAHHDAAVVEAINWDLLSVDDRRATATINSLSSLRVASGGWKRNQANLSDYDNNEWLFVDFSASRALRRLGRINEADYQLSRIATAASAQSNLLPELYNALPQNGPIGAYTGAVPMVGYGAAAWISSLLDRGGFIEPQDCQANPAPPSLYLACRDDQPPVVMPMPDPKLDGCGFIAGAASFGDLLLVFLLIGRRRR